MFYAACLVGWLSVGVFPSYRAFVAEDEKVQTAFYATIPAMTPEAIAEEIKAIIAAPPGESAVSYFDSLARISNLRESARKGMREGRELDYPAYTNLFGTGIGYLHQAYIKKFGNEAMLPARESWEATHKRVGFPEREAVADEGKFWQYAYFTSLPFALLFLLVRLDAVGHSILIELFSPLYLLLAVFCWPIGVFKYPSGDAARQVVRGLRFAAFFLTTSLSGFAGTAVAQTTSPTQKKKDDPQTLQIDLRSSKPLGTGLPDIFGRATVITSKGFFFETVDTARKDRWNLTGVVGKRFMKTRTLAAYVVGGVARSSLGFTSVIAGVQAFQNTKHFSLLLPAVYYERLDDEKKSFALANFAVVKTKQFRFGTDSSFRKTEGQKVQWSLGPLFARNVGNGFAEAAVIHNSQGEWRVRGRLVHSFAW